MRPVLFIILLFSFAPDIFSQQKEFIFKNFTQEDGLPSNETYAVFEDSKHFLWIASDLGVARYDGNKFETFNLPDNVIFKIREDIKGRIWFFSFRGVLAYFENEKMYPYRYNPVIENRINKIHIIDCKIDTNSNIYLNSYIDSNFIISDAGSIAAQRHSYPTKRNCIECTIEVLNKNTCFTTMNRTSAGAVIDSAIIHVIIGKTIKHYYVKAPLGRFAHYSSIRLDNGDIYFYAGRALIKIPENGALITKKMPEKIISMGLVKNKLAVGMHKTGAVMLDLHSLNAAGDTILPNKSVTAITTDYEGGIWFSTLENGVYYAKSTLIKRLQDNSVTDDHVSRVFNVDNQYLVYAKSTGFYQYDNLKSALICKYSNLTVVDMFAGEDHSLYAFGSEPSTVSSKKINVPGFTQLYLFDAPSEPVNLKNNSLIVSRPASVHFVTLRNAEYEGQDPMERVWKFDKEVLPKPAKLFLDRQNKVWAGCNDGLYLSSSKMDTFLKFHPENKVLQKGIGMIRQLHNGLLAASVRSAGIVLLDSTGITVAITESEGLLSNKIRYLLPLKNDLWVATAKGISVIQFNSFNPVTYSIKNIGKNDGFFNITINQLTEYKNNIVAATSHGIFFIEEPEKIITPSSIPVPFYITAVTSNTGDTTNISSITIPYEKNRLVIKYRAVCFNDNENVQYLYKFSDEDTAWHSTTNRERLFENLAPGTYRLQLKALIPGQQRFSDIQSITIIIQKPWWQNNLFRLLVVAVIGSVIYAGVTRRIKKVQNDARKKTALHSRLAELEQTALRAQMNPHFIFNCLTSIQQLIISGNKTEANEYLVKFSRLIRKTLDISAQPFISIANESEYIREYLFLEQLRLTGKFDYSITIDTSIKADQFLIPNMMLQPIVENCVRHGIKSLHNKKGLITVHFERKGHSIKCTVTDNGTGRKPVKDHAKPIDIHKSYGMDIVRKRLTAFAAFNKDESGMTIKDLLNSDGSAAGTEVVLILPLNTRMT